jgi:hypothetical protein
MARSRTRTRRVTRRRGGAGIEDLIRLSQTPEGKKAFELAKQGVKAASASPEGQQALRLVKQGVKAAYESPQGQELKRQAQQQAMEALRNPEMRRSLLQSMVRGGKTRRSRRRLQK